MHPHTPLLKCTCTCTRPRSLLMIGAMLLEEVDQSVSRAIVAGNVSILCQFGLDGFGKLLAQFNTPLIV
eukprot:m.104503 g.104503  ORF g.104503 m.104503 type:complete len:69 (+) comp15249_c0_seq1:762-968(+)